MRELNPHQAYLQLYMISFFFRNFILFSVATQYTYQPIMYRCFASPLLSLSSTLFEWGLYCLCFVHLQLVTWCLSWYKRICGGIVMTTASPKHRGRHLQPGNHCFGIHTTDLSESHISCFQPWGNNWATSLL